jgi:hypothetical protein
MANMAYLKMPLARSLRNPRAAVEQVNQKNTIRVTQRPPKLLVQNSEDRSISGGCFYNAFSRIYNSLFGRAVIGYRGSLRSWLAEGGCSRENTDSWAINAKRRIPEDIDQIEEANRSAAEELLIKIRGHESQFREMARYGVAGLRISIVSELLPPCLLSADLLRQISGLGVDLEIEISAA